MAFTSTNDVFEALEAQLADQMDVGSLIRYDGSPEAAFERHFEQPTSGVRSFIFYGLGDDVPDNLSGGGDALRQELVVDFYVAIRSTGRSDYRKAIARISDLSDTLMFTAFDNAKWVSQMKSRIAGKSFGFRRSVPTNASDLFVHQVRFTITPRR
jgi:hypothetical protein